MDPTIKPEKANCDEIYATRAETDYAVRHLTRADHVKLMIIARYFFRKRLQSSTIEAEDLLQEALIKTIDGRRQWNKNVCIIKHLDRVMESDSGHLLEHDIAFKKEPIPEEKSDEPNLFSDHRNNTEARLDILSILRQFKDDKIARELLDLQAQGFEASDIQEKMEINKSKYETTTKRIRRRLLKFIATEGKNYETKGNEPIDDESSSP